MSKLTTYQRKARDLMQREDWDGALSELQRVLGIDANNPTLHNQIGDVYLRKGSVEQACDHFELAVDLYSNLSLHNNAVALCRKVVRLAPTRVEVRYHLARLRMDQGLRSDATVAFIDYLEHAQPSDDAAADALEQRCVEVVESFPDLAPVGQIVEKLETVKRPQGAYKIVQRAAQRATDSGDSAAATRLTEKMRSLRVLLESQGNSVADGNNVPLDPSAVELSDAAPEIDLSVSPGDPAAVGPGESAQTHIDPTALDLPSEPEAVVAGQNEVSQDTSVAQNVAQNIDLPQVDMPAAESPSTADLVDMPPAAEDALLQAEIDAEATIPEIDLDSASSLDDAVAELESVMNLGAQDASGAVAAGSGDAASTEQEPVDDSLMPEYELPETSLEEVASLLQQEGVEPTDDSGVSDMESATTVVDLSDAPELLMPEVVEASEASSAGSEVRVSEATPLLQSEEVEEAGVEPQTMQPVASNGVSGGSSSDAASIAETFADPPAAVSEPQVLDQPVSQAPEPEAGAGIQQDVDSGMIPQMDPDDRPASVVYEPAPESRRLSSADEVRREPVWIPGPNTDSVDPHPSEEGQTQELEEVIDTFREQMAKALGDDGAARYDLGVAYYEMELYNEALAEFEVAVKCPGLSTRTLEMMSSCLSQQGRHDEVVSLLAGPLSEPENVFPGDRLSLQYAMGVALEAVGQQDDARRHFEEVALVDIGFKDVQSRLQR